MTQTPSTDKRLSARCGYGVSTSSNWRKIRVTLISTTIAITTTTLTIAFIVSNSYAQNCNNTYTSPGFGYSCGSKTNGSTQCATYLGGPGGPCPNTSTGIVLQVRSDSDWSGSYDDGTGTNSTDGSGNKDIPMACNSNYAATFEIKSDHPGTLTLNVVKNGININSHSTNARFGVVSVSGQC